MNSRTTVICVRGRRTADLLADTAFVYVGRPVPRLGWKGSPWGNPFKVHSPRMLSYDNRMVGAKWLREAEAAIEAEGVPKTAVELHRRWLLSQPDYLANLWRLRGKVLGCWCGDWEPGRPDIGCHAVTLARLADRPEV